MHFHEYLHQNLKLLEENYHLKLKIDVRVNLSIVIFVIFTLIYSFEISFELSPYKITKIANNDLTDSYVTFAFLLIN